jgi:hypothetical protein
VQVPDVLADAGRASRDPRGTTCPRPRSTAEARKESDRHERRVRELIGHQHKLLNLYYEDGVSKEVLQAQQKRLEAEQATAQRLADAAKFEVSELDQALSDALLLVDQRRVPYLTGSPTEKRLINLAVYKMLLVSASGDIEIQPTPLYVELVPLARELAIEAIQVRPKMTAAPLFGATV